jgi:hypothetical protein
MIHSIHSSRWRSHCILSPLLLLLQGKQEQKRSRRRTVVLEAIPSSCLMTTSSINPPRLFTPKTYSDDSKRQRVLDERRDDHVPILWTTMTFNIAENLESMALCNRRETMYSTEQSFLGLFGFKDISGAAPGSAFWVEKVEISSPRSDVKRTLRFFDLYLDSGQHYITGSAIVETRRAA